MVWGRGPSSCFCMWILSKKKLFWPLQDDKDDFIWNYWNGVLQQGTEIGLNSKYNMEKWGFIAKERGERGELVCEKLLKENIRIKGGILAKLTWQYSCWSQTRVIRDHLWDQWGTRNFIRQWQWGFFLNRIKRFLLILGDASPTRMDTESWGMEGLEKPEWN